MELAFNVDLCFDNRPGMPFLPENSSLVVAVIVVGFLR